MAVPYYPGALYTPKLGLGLFGQDEVLADNFVILDAAFGSGSSINVDGTLVISPNLSSTTPAAPGGDELVHWQFDSNGNISAYVPTSGGGGVASITGDSVVYNNVASTGAVTLSLISQTANTVFAGPISGGNATPTFRALVAADIPNAANLPLWSNLQNSSANLTLANGGFTTTFNQTSNVVWMWANTTVATVATTNASPLFELTANYWTGAASAQDIWSIGSSLTAGANRTSSFNLTHTGSTGLINLNISTGGNTVLNFSTAAAMPSVYTLSVPLARHGLVLSGNMTTDANLPGVTLANVSSFTGITGQQIGVAVGSGTNPITFAPISGNANFIGTETYSICSQTGSAAGNFTGFAVITTSSAGTGFLGTTFLTADFQNDWSGSIASVFQIGKTGAICVGTLTDSTGSVGTSGQLLSSTVTGTGWVTAPTGFANPMTTLGDIIYENATPAAARLAGNTTTTKEYLSQTGNGTISAAPAWAQIAVTDLANIAGGTVLGNTGTTAGAVAATASPVLGIPGTSTGSIAIASSTASGKYTVTAPANAATPTLTLPTTSNVLAGQFAGDNVLYSNTPVGATAAGTLVLPTLSAQTANFVFAGPTSGSAAAPTFRALVAADIPNAANLPLWSNLQNAAGALTLANGTNATTFNQTSAVAWLWANTTVATSGTTNASPLLELAANYWTGAASAADTWTIGSSLAAGTNGVSTLAIAHNGSAGSAAVTLPRVGLTNVGTLTTVPSVFDNAIPTTGIGFASGQISFMDTTSAFLYSARGFLLTPAAAVIGWTTNTNAAGTQDTGISRLGAASLAIGNGTASDTTGNLSFNKVIKYAGVATVSQGVPAEYAVSDLTTQSAAITATTLYATTATGMYRVSWSATITTADGVSSVLGGAGGFQVLYTSPTDSVVKTTVSGNSVTSAANTTGTAVGGCEVIYAKTGTNIQFQYGYTSATPGQMVFEIHIKVEAM